LSNALKAVYDRSQRRIVVEAEKINRVLYLRMMDTGHGLPPEWRDNPDIAFKPFVTRSMPNLVLGVGTGLGLKVVKDILDQYAGDAHFIEVSSPWSTCIEIELPERGN
jgi:C4-dicarboxylate-specific signal transduction histidine kinase